DFSTLSLHDALPIFKGHLNTQVAFARQRVGHLKRDPRFACLEAVIKIIHVDFQEFAVADGGKGLGRLSGQVGHYPHYKWQLNLRSEEHTSELQSLAY